MKRIATLLFSALLLMISCNEVDPVYPDEPVVDYQGFGLYITTDPLGNNRSIPPT